MDKVKNDYDPLTDDELRALMGEHTAQHDAQDSYLSEIDTFQKEVKTASPFRLELLAQKIPTIKYQLQQIKDRLVPNTEGQKSFDMIEAETLKAFETIQKRNQFRDIGTRYRNPHHDGDEKEVDEQPDWVSKPTQHIEENNDIEENQNVKNLISSVQKFIDAQIEKGDKQSLPELGKEIRECRNLLVILEQQDHVALSPDQKQQLINTKLDLQGMLAKLVELDYKGHPEYKKTNHEISELLEKLRKKALQTNVESIDNFNNYPEVMYDHWKSLSEIESILKEIDEKLPLFEQFFLDEATVLNRPSLWTEYKDQFESLRNSFLNKKTQVVDKLSHFEMTNDFSVLKFLLSANRRIDANDIQIFDTLLSNLPQEERERAFDQIIFDSSISIPIAESFISAKDKDSKYFLNRDNPKSDEILKDLEEDQIVLSKILQYCHKYVSNREAKILTLSAQINDLKNEVIKLDVIVPDFIKRLEAFSLKASEEVQNMQASSSISVTIEKYFSDLQRMIKDLDILIVENARFNYLMNDEQVIQTAQLITTISLSENDFFQRIRFAIEDFIKDISDKTESDNLKSLLVSLQRKYTELPRGRKAITNSMPQYGPRAKKPPDTFERKFSSLLEEIQKLEQKKTEQIE